MIKHMHNDKTRIFYIITQYNKNYIVKQNNIHKEDINRKNTLNCIVVGKMPLCTQMHTYPQAHFRIIGHY